MKIMQQLSVKLKNTPMDASQVRSSVNSALNRDQSLSEQSIVLADNNLEVNPQQHTVEQILSAIVYVIDVAGKNLIPATSIFDFILKEGRNSTSPT